MANPRKRKAIKDGRMEQMIREQNEQSISEIETENDTKPPATTTVKAEEASPPMDPFIAKEIEEIDRIPSNNKKTMTKKKTATKKKIATKKKTGGK
jgi:hypothetical protein